MVTLRHSLSLSLSYVRFRFSILPPFLSSTPFVGRCNLPCLTFILCIVSYFKETVFLPLVSRFFPPFRHFFFPSPPWIYRPFILSVEIFCLSDSSSIYSSMFDYLYLFILSSVCYSSILSPVIRLFIYLLWHYPGFCQYIFLSFIICLDIQVIFLYLFI